MFTVNAAVTAVRYLNMASQLERQDMGRGRKRSELTRRLFY